MVDSGFFAQWLLPYWQELPWLPTSILNNISQATNKERERLLVTKPFMDQDSFALFYTQIGQV